MAVGAALSGAALAQGDGRVFPCMYCGAGFPHQSKLTRHILSHSLETLKYREALGRALPLPPLGALPLLDAAPPPPPPYAPHDEPLDLDLAHLEPGNVVLCKFCGKSFPDVSSLIAHLPVHTGDRPFKCEFCGKAFKLRHHMKDHCRVHTGKFHSTSRHSKARTLKRLPNGYPPLGSLYFNLGKHNFER